MHCKTQSFSVEAMPAYKISCVVAGQPSHSSAHHSMKAKNQSAHQPLQINTRVVTSIHPGLFQMRPTDVYTPIQKANVVIY